MAVVLIRALLQAYWTAVGLYADHYYTTGFIMQAQKAVVGYFSSD